MGTAGALHRKAHPMWRPLDWTIAKIHEQGGLAIAVHPFSMLTRSIGFRSFDGIMKHSSPDIYFDAVETFNPSVAGRTCAAKIDRLNKSRFHLPEVGCSDSHHSRESAPGTRRSLARTPRT